MCTFQPGNFTGWGSEGLTLSAKRSISFSDQESFSFLHHIGNDIRHSNCEGTVAARTFSTGTCQHHLHTPAFFRSSKVSALSSARR